MAADAALARLIDQVCSARAQRSVLDIRGGGTKAFYGEAAQGEPLDVRPLAGISSYEPTELVVTVRAGTPLAELEAALAEQGQWLPFEPPHFGAAGGVAGGTVGGMVAAGLAGPARAAAGGVRDYLLGATLLDGRGQVLSFGGQVMKNVAGYDLSRVLAGSMGILGVICEVSLKVLPRPVAAATLRFELDAGAAIRRVNEWSGRPLPISASAWWDGLLVLRLAGAAAAVAAAQRELGGEPVPPELAAGFWAGLRDHRDEYFVAAQAAVEQGASLWRLSLPQVAQPLVLPGSAAAAGNDPHEGPAPGTPAEPMLIEWGGAQRWLCSRLPAAQVRAAAQAAGGHAVLFRAQDKSAGAFAPLPEPLLRIQRELKAALDPDRIFNPGRLYPQL